jgi:hypothetical protein
VLLIDYLVFYFIFWPIVDDYVRHTIKGCLDYLLFVFVNFLFSVFEFGPFHSQLVWNSIRWV